MSNFDLTRFLRDLWQQGVEFWLEGEQLKFRGNKALMNGDTLGLLRDHKPAIIRLLRENPEAYLGFPLSHGQRGIYLMQNLAPDSSAYNLMCLLQLQNDLNIPALQNSLDFLLQRHAPLRMSVINLDGCLAQQVSFSLPNILAITEEPGASEEELKTWACAEADKPFRIGNEPLVRAHLRRHRDRGEYYLLLVAHHIIADFWAIDLLVQELAIIYAAALTGQPPQLPDISKLYKDYVLHEQQWLASEQGKAAAHYWKETLSPLPSPLELPADLPRPARPGFNGREYHATLTPEFTARLKAAARDAHVTPFVWTLSAWQALLHRYSGEDRIAVGTPMACRTQLDFQKLAGHFTNPVALTSDFSQIKTFNDLLQTNKQQLKLAIKYQEYPLQCLLEDLQGQRDNSSTPLFQTVISWNQLPGEESNPLIQQLVSSEQRGAIYDLVLTAYDQSDCIRFSLRYNTELFTTACAARIHAHLMNILEDTISRHGESVIGKIDYRTDEERQLLANFNATARPITDNRNLGWLFRQTALAYPGLPALKDGDTLYSYADIEARSNRMANFLAAQGVQAGDHVAICLVRSLEMLTCILGVLKTGATYIPIDTSYPADRIGYMAGQSEARLFISSKSMDENLTHVRTQAPHTSIVWMEDINALLEEFSTSFAIPADGLCSYNDIACVLYTSGSTGRPKGVKTPHRAIVRLCTNTTLFTMQPGEKFCYLSNISFDATNIEIWGAFLNGGTLVKVDNTTLLTPRLFANFLEQEKPKAALITTALFNVLVAHQPDMFRHFTYMFVGGEAFDPGTARRCVTQGKPAHLINVYGPTENGTLSTVYEITDPELPCIPIGRPISNSQAYVVDRYGIDCPIGVIGEIIVGGEGVSTGYLAQPEMTAERFFPDHYRGQGLLYATGDLGYLRADGELIYAGRKDNQVKIRGYRIELGEIEQCLANHPDVLQSCVIVHRSNGHASLRAYYSATTAINSNAMKNWLRQHLPEFMVPAALLQMDALPLNPNGKIDRHKLPDIVIEKQAGHVAPRNATEETIARIWQEFLHIENPGIEDNFFEIGGHSLLAMRIAGALQEELQVDISMRELFEYPTIAALATALDAQAGNSMTDIQPVADKNRLPASASQQRLWFMQQLAPLSTAYNMPVALRIVKTVDARLLEYCIRQLLLRHEALRTTFTDDNGIARAVIHDTDNWTLPVSDFSKLTHAEANLQAQQALDTLANHPFNLANDLPCQALLLHLPDNEHILAFCLHHIAADGLSVDILLSELGQLWMGGRQLSPPAVSYTDFSIWQHEMLQGKHLQQQLAYWQQQLDGAPAALNLPLDKPRPAVASTEGGEWRLTIPAITGDRLRSLAQENGATLFVTLLAAYSLLLSRYTQQNDLCIGFPIACRNHKSVAGMVGLFVNNLAIRCNLQSNSSFSHYLQQVKQTTINAFSHQDVPFDMIVDALKVERSLSYLPFLQASFSLEHSTLESRVASSLGSNVSIEQLNWHVAKYDLHLTCLDEAQYRGHHLEAVIEYNTSLFLPETIERFSRHYLALLEAIVANPDAHIHDITFLSALEFEQQMDMVSGWNATQYTYPPADSLHELIEAQATATPNAPALVDEHQQLTYAEMNASANRLAHYLRAHGINRNQPVVACLDRSIQMSIALLAILKAGGCYVPMTTDIPVSRISFICNDTGARVLLSTSGTILEGLDTSAHRINVDDDSAWQTFPDNNPPAVTGGDDLFNIIYTSGSTGNPKGVMVPHRGIINRLRWMQHAYPIGLHDKILQKTPFNFDVSVWELFWPLLHGSTLVFAKPEGHKNPEYLRDTIICHGITTVHFVPSMLGVFLQTSGIEACRSLRQVFASGEALQLNHSHAFFRRLPQAGLFNLYGPTEASIDVSYYNCVPDEHRSAIPIGKPIHNTQLHILDAALNVLPLGVAGDLYIGGEGLATGYWNQPELTARTFIPNPFHSSGHPSARLYKTGDVARYLSDGNIEYLGRSDHQVKIRGLRVELGEIEAALGKQPGVKECIVVLKGSDASQRLVAYLLTNNMDLDTSAMAMALKAVLPEYMVPSAYVLLAEWPLSANGKIDRKRLPEPAAAQQDYVAPRNASEQALADIWASLLGTEKVGINDNFFELGGHSLMATQMASRIRSTLNCTLELKAIFENPTIATLAVHILEQEVQALDISDAELLALLGEIEGE